MSRVGTNRAPQVARARRIGTLLIPRALKVSAPSMDVPGVAYKFPQGQLRRLSMIQQAPLLGAAVPHLSPHIPEKAAARITVLCCCVAPDAEDTPSAPPPR